MKQSAAPQRRERGGAWYYDSEAVQPVDELELRRLPRWYARGGPVGGFATEVEAQAFAAGRCFGEAETAADLMGGQQDSSRPHLEAL